MLIKRCNRLVQLAHQTLWFLIAFLLWASYEVPAKERAFRVFDHNSGLPATSLSGFAQDTDGFFWFGTAAGLYRYDGQEFRHWAKEKISGWHYQVYAGPKGEVLVTCLPDNTLYRILPNEEAELVTGPNGKPFANVQDAAFTNDGRLWVSRLDALFYRNEQGAWIEMPPEIRSNERIWQVTAGLDGVLWVATTHGIWRINPNLSYQKILTRNFDGYIGNVIAHPDGSFFYMEKYPDGGKIFQWRDGQVTERLALKTNLHAFALRGETLWANGDGYLVAFRPNREPEVLQADKDQPIGGAMVVDHEGSLWMGNGRELFQLPEPETEIWTPRDGLPDLGPIALKEAAQGIWLSTWSGVGHLEHGAGNEWHVHNDHLMHQGEMCNDGQGSLWLYDYQNFWQRWQGKSIKYPQSTGTMAGCDEAPDGAVWMSTTRGFWRLKTGETPRLVSHSRDHDEAGKVFEDSRGRLWLTSDEKICHAPVAPLKAGQPVEWSCETIKGAGGIGKPAELPDGSLWAGTDLQGVLRHVEGAGWQSIPASLKLASKSTGRLVLSPAGGIWVLGMTARIRVLPRPDLPDGWQVVEQLSNLQGIPPGGVWDLVEERAGCLWVITTRGLAHLPATARYPKFEPPRVRFVGLLINGQRVGSIPAPRIPAGRNQVELQFAALSYRDRSLLRYQYKVHPNDAWTEATGNIPLFRFYDLGSGRYTVEVRASLDGINWSSVPARMSFEILLPWYFRWWAIGLYILAVALVLLLAHRLRVRVLLQLERQRTRIAMDLHDEIGSGLGSIGILSSVAASQTVGEDQRQEMTKRIAETADELGTSLTDIVWSLRADATTLESLAVHLARRAESLFASDGTQFTTRFPDDWHAVNLSLTTRRNVLLIAMELLHNAAKHAQAENVMLQFERSDGRRWLMRIEDDGRGLHRVAGNNGLGMGMETMRRRAEEMNAELSFTSKNGRGTIVSLTFHPQAREHG